MVHAPSLPVGFSFTGFPLGIHSAPGPEATEYPAVHAGAAGESAGLDLRLWPV